MIVLATAGSPQARAGTDTEALLLGAEELPRPWQQLYCVRRSLCRPGSLLGPPG
jgi:hypothetical protein